MPRLQRAYEPLGTALREGRRVFLTSDDLVEDFFHAPAQISALDTEDEDEGYTGLTATELAVARARGDFDWS